VGKHDLLLVTRRTHEIPQHGAFVGTIGWADLSVPRGPASRLLGEAPTHSAKIVVCGLETWCALIGLTALGSSWGLSPQPTGGLAGLDGPRGQVRFQASSRAVERRRPVPACGRGSPSEFSSPHRSWEAGSTRRQRTRPGCRSEDGHPSRGYFGGRRRRLVERTLRTMAEAPRRTLH